MYIHKVRHSIKARELDGLDKMLVLRHYQEYNDQNCKPICTHMDGLQSNTAINSCFLHEFRPFTPFHLINNKRFIKNAWDWKQLPGRHYQDSCRRTVQSFQHQLPVLALATLWGPVTTLA